MDRGGRKTRPHLYHRREEVIIKGWIKLHRKLLKKGWFKTSTLVHFWVYCLLKATHKPIRASVGYQQIYLRRGQFITGRERAAEQTGLSEGQVRHCLEILEKVGSIAVKSTNKFSIITIVNWAKYQRRSPSNNQEHGQQAADKAPHTRRSKKKEIIRSKAPMAQGGDFMPFWDQCFKKKYRVLYNWEENEEALAKKLSEKYPQKNLKALGKEYFDSSDPSVQDSGHSIAGFSSWIKGNIK